jgi:hypothetical protein
MRRLRKPIYAWLIVSLLLLTTSLPVIAATAKQNNASPLLEKVTFIHYLSDGDHSKPVWDDTVTDYRFIAGGIRWFDTISYVVSTVNMPAYLDAEWVLSTLEKSSETWDDAVTNEFFGKELFSSPTLTDEPVVSGDGKNSVGWGLLEPGVIAVTTIWYEPATKRIVEFDIIFNTYYPWGDATKTPNVMDLQNIATHEFGHNGLADLRPPKDAELTMYYASTFGEIKKRTLGVGDVLGIQALYGA